MGEKNPTVEFWEKVKAREELEKRGYTKVRCKACEGLGGFYPGDRDCPSCDGQGYHWQGPMIC